MNALNLLKQHLSLIADYTVPQIMLSEACEIDSDFRENLLAIRQSLRVNSVAN